MKKNIPTLVRAFSMLVVGLAIGGFINAAKADVVMTPDQVIWNTQAGTPLGSFPQLAGLHTTQQGILGSASVGPTYLNPPTDYSLTNSTLFVTGANGRVGINTVTPNSAYKLDVNGKVNVTEFCLAGVCRTSWPVCD